MDRRVGDVAGRQTHSHGRHCTPRRRRRKPDGARPYRASAGAAEQLPVERHHLVDPAGHVEAFRAPSRAASPWRRGAPGRRPASRWPLPGACARVRSPADRTTHAIDSVAHRVAPRPGPASATTGRPTASASARTRPCVSVCDAKAKRSAPATADSASSRGIRPGSATRPARSGAAARAAVASAAGPSPISTSRSRGSRPAATAKASSSSGHVLLRRQAAMAGHDHRVGRPAVRRAEVARRERLQRSDVDAGRDDPHQRPPPRTQALPDLRGQRAARRHDRGAARPEVAAGMRSASPRPRRPAAPGSGGSRRTGCDA